MPECVMEETTSAEGDTRMIDCTTVSKRERGEEREVEGGRKRESGEVSERDREAGERAER